MACENFFLLISWVLCQIVVCELFAARTTVFVAASTDENFTYIAHFVLVAAFVVAKGFAVAISSVETVVADQLVLSVHVLKSVFVVR
jgi:hypothetical protein